MKYLVLIRSITLLHQYQREHKIATHRGERVEYIEVTAADIALANELAHEVLGRSLDELPPQARRLLWVTVAMPGEAVVSRRGSPQSRSRMACEGSGI